MGRFIDQSPPDPLPPKLRLDEQTVQFTVDNSSEPKDFTAELGHEHLTIGNLRGGKVDCIRVGFEVRTVAVVRKRGPPLKLFDLLPLIVTREPKAQRVSVL